MVQGRLTELILWPRIENAAYCPKERDGTFGVLSICDVTAEVVFKGDRTERRPVTNVRIKMTTGDEGVLRRQDTVDGAWPHIAGSHELMAVANNDCHSQVIASFQHYSLPPEPAVFPTVFLWQSVVYGHNPNFFAEYHSNVSREARRINMRARE